MKEFKPYARRKTDFEEPVRRLSVELPATLHERFKARCAERGELISRVVRDLLAREISSDAQK